MTRITVTGLKERISWLKAETEKAEKQLAKLLGNGPAVQVELPGVPAAPVVPRKKSESEVLHEVFQEARARKLAAMGVVSPDENAVPFINTVMPKIRADCRDTDELLHVFDAFFADDYAASGGQDRKLPPFALRILAGPGVRARLLAYVRGEPTTQLPRRTA